MCNCRSYNWEIGDVSEVVVTVPENIRACTDGRETVSIDACIVDAIQALWAKGLPTLNSCCGHNRAEVSVIIPDDAEPQVYLDVLKECDGRDWVVSRWERIDYRSKD